MIGGYSDHAANERTYLAWVRTGIAITAFGFVIEKFNLFILTLASTAVNDDTRRLQLAALAGRVGRYDGLALARGVWRWWSWRRYGSCVSRASWTTVNPIARRMCALSSPSRPSWCC